MSSSEDELLNVTQVMNLLNVSRMTVHRRVRSGKLKPANTPSPALERKSNLLFRREDVEKLLSEKDEDASSEPQPEQELEDCAA